MPLVTKGLNGSNDSLIVHAIARSKMIRKQASLNVNRLCPGTEPKTRPFPICLVQNSGHDLPSSWSDVGGPVDASTVISLTSPPKFQLSSQLDRFGFYFFKYLSNQAISSFITSSKGCPL